MSYRKDSCDLGSYGYQPNTHERGRGRGAFNQNFGNASSRINNQRFQSSTSEGFVYNFGSNDNLPSSNIFVNRGGFQNARGGGNFDGTMDSRNQVGFQPGRDRSASNFADGRGNFNGTMDSRNQVGFQRGRDLSASNYADGRGNFNGTMDSRNQVGFQPGRDRSASNFDDGRGNFNQAPNNFNNRNSNASQRGNRGFNNHLNNTSNNANLPAQHSKNQGVQHKDELKENEQHTAHSTYIPVARNPDMLIKEDLLQVQKYASIAETDDDVHCENFSGDVLYFKTWEEAELDSSLLNTIKNRCKYVRPRKIQSFAMPFILDYFDVLAQSETGTGKTAAFIVSIIQMCLDFKKDGTFKSETFHPFAIIVGPTRELVLQLFEQAQKFASGLDVTVAKAYGQYTQSENFKEILTGCDILCATPGRLIKFLDVGVLCPKNLRSFVLDEADRMLDEKFIVDIKYIINSRNFPPTNLRQTLLFSATYPPEIKKLATEMMRSDAVIITNKKMLPNKKIKQDFIVAFAQEKMDKLIELLKAEAVKAGGVKKIRPTIVFVNEIFRTQMVTHFLNENGIPATSISSSREQSSREQALHDLRNSQISVLVSTDVGARGLDIKELEHVIILDLPKDIETYIYRIGRVGRITQGFATIFVNKGDALLNEIAEKIRENGEEIPATLNALLPRSNGVNDDWLKWG